MIVDNLTKFNQKKKLWMTPKHPLYGKSVEYTIWCGRIYAGRDKLPFKPFK